MGNKFVALTSDGTLTKCTTDSDCYPASVIVGGVYDAATTDAEKALRCCSYWTVLKEPTGTDAQKLVLEPSLAGVKKGGLSSTVGEYNLSCSKDYPAVAAYYAAMSSLSITYDAKTGIVTYPEAYANW
jgi:hypothetical protein